MSNFEEGLIQSHLAQLGIQVSSLGEVWWNRMIEVVPDEGWKIHISAHTYTLMDVLTRATPVLKGCNFKVVKSLPMLEALNYGVYGARAVGKALTLYPTSTSQFVDMAEELSRLLRGMEGPLVKGERCFAECPVLYYRYAAYGTHVIDRWGRRWPSVIGPDGCLVPDHPDAHITFPIRRFDPFESRSMSFVELEETSQGHVSKVFAQYGLELVGMLRDGHRKVARARDVHHSGLRRIVKWLNRRHVSSDIQDSMRRERDASLSLYGYAPVPLLVSQHEDEQILLLIFEDLGDETLWERVVQKPEELPELVQKTIEALALVHARGLVVGDISPWNMVWYQGKVYFVDLEHCALMGLPMKSYGVTQGFDSPYEPGNWRRDIAALGHLILCLASGVKPTAWDNQLDCKRVAQLLTNAPPVVQAIALETVYSNQTDMPSTMPLLHLLIRGQRQEMISPFEPPLPDTCIMVHLAIRELKREARQNSGGWSSARRDARSTGVTLLDGDMGVAWFLLSAATDDEEAVMFAAQAVESALDNEEMMGIGLYTGLSGIALVAAACARLLERQELAARAIELMRHIGRRTGHHLDLVSGIAGRMIAALQIHNLVEGSDLLDQVRRDAYILVDVWKSAHTDSNGKTHRYDVPRKEGAALGWIGIAGALLSARQCIPDTVCIDKCILEIEEQTDISFGSLQQNISTQCNFRLASWWHGWAGLGLFQLHAYHQSPCLQRRNRIETTLAKLRASRFVDGSLCYGVAGALLFALRAKAAGFGTAQALADRCVMLLAGLHIQTEAGITWHAGERPSSSYMLGASGIAHVLAGMPGAAGILLPHE